ncbi:replicative DNA helicase [Catellatospora methionotrophica]|uniref:Replicative DNA helicase n=1 Tax=Catellatospora methionotrophica TaxID=121620 RepID=A0A8J3PGM5_9ACTN|nr:replicative DNA helicase [Catellatospora methionotrophica]GIG15513.1 replicative DNA helicase [Catellatospora methionotrophica]
MNDRVPPHDLAAEQVVLGSMMLNHEAVAIAVERLRPEDFYRNAHGVIFASIIGAWADREPTDEIAIATRLQVAGDLARIGGPIGLHALVEAVPVAASIGYYAKTVAERANVRRIIEAGTRIAQMAYESNGEIGELPAHATKLIANAVDDRQQAGLTHVSEMVNDSLDAIEEARNGGRGAGILTGIHALDDATGGFRPGQMIIVAGRPGMGKSVMGIEAARDVAMSQRKQVAIFTLEMSRTEVLHRLYSAMTSIEISRIVRGQLSDADWTKISRAAAQVADAPILIDDSAPLTLPIIAARARRAHARSPLALVVIDYLQLIKTGRRAENRQQEVTEISQGVKLLAKELGCPVLIAAQLNRNNEGRTDKRPQLSDLRESGSLEQDADLVILLHRDNYYDPDTPRGNEIDVILAKQRSGQTGAVVAGAQFEYVRFVNLPQL